MKVSIARRHVLPGIFAGLIALSSIGCTMFRPASNINSRPLDPGTAVSLQGANGKPTQADPIVTVAIKPDFGRKKNLSLPLEEGMTLQDVLLEARVTRRFRDMKITVMRVTPQSKGQRVPLQAKYNPAKNCVGVLHDMTLYPSDHIVIIEDNKLRMDETISKLLGGARG